MITDSYSNMLPSVNTNTSYTKWLYHIIDAVSGPAMCAVTALTLLGIMYLTIYVYIYIYIYISIHIYSEGSSPIYIYKKG